MKMSIIKSVFRYLFPKLKTMSLSDKVKKLKEELLNNCKNSIELLETSKRCVTIGYIGGNDVKPPGEQITSSISAEVIFPKITDVEIVQNFMVLTHGVLIQEWEHFLYGIFFEGVI